MTIFTDLCDIATDNTITFDVAVIINKAIKQTEEGRLCESLIEQYNEGLITFAEFYKAFIAATRN